MSMIQPPSETWAPSTAQVAAFIASRTLLPSGDYAGDFTSATRPTGMQVNTIIALLVSEIAGTVGVTSTVLATVPELAEQATWVAALGAAAMVELSYFPEQVRTEQSSYPDLDSRYTEALDRLIYSVAEGGEGESLSPVSTFPDTNEFLTPVPYGADVNAAPQTTFWSQY